MLNDASEKDHKVTSNFVFCLGDWNQIHGFISRNYLSLEFASIKWRTSNHVTIWCMNDGMHEACGIRDYPSQSKETSKVLKSSVSVLVTFPFPVFSSSLVVVFESVYGRRSTCPCVYRLCDLDISRSRWTEQHHRGWPFGLCIFLISHWRNLLMLVSVVSPVCRRWLLQRALLCYLLL